MLVWILSNRGGGRSFQRHLSFADIYFFDLQQRFSPILQNVVVIHQLHVVANGHTWSCVAAEIRDTYHRAGNARDRKNYRAILARELEGGNISAANRAAAVNFHAIELVGDSTISCGRCD